MQVSAEPLPVRRIEFNEQWKNLQNKDAFRGKVDMSLPKTGVSTASFSYPAGKYHVESSDHWGVGIVKRPFEVDYFSSGRLKYGRRTIYQGQIVVSEPNSEFDAKLRGHGDVEYLVFSQERFSRCLPPELKDLQELPDGLETRIQSNLLTSLVTAMTEDTNRGAEVSTFYFDAIVDAVIAELLRGIFLKSLSSSAADNTLSDSALRQLERYIREHLQAKIEIGDLANCLGMTPASLRRGLKDRTGQTPYQLILSTRLQSAQSMLTTTDSPAAKIAFDCGFSSQSHMSDLFRQKLGQTPGQVRASSR